MNIPWWLKLGAKIVLSRMPLNYKAWQSLGLFRHGRMDQSDYLMRVFTNHMSRTNMVGQLKGKTILELGPGDSIGTALIGASHGAKVVLIDTGAYATQRIDFYGQLSEKLQSSGLNPPDLSKACSLDDILKSCKARYFVDGLPSFNSLESASVDLIFSQAVLEHVRKKEFVDLLGECRRVLSSSGISSHRVDLKDHLGGNLNNLRFSEGVWESDFFIKSGFYTNRIRFTEMIEVFKKSGFQVDMLNLNYFDKLPINPKRLHSDFASLPENELMISGFDVVLRPI